MSVERWDLWHLGSNSMADDDTVEDIGGAIDLTRKMDYAPLNESAAVGIVAVSDSASDTGGPYIRAYGRDGAGVKKDTGVGELILTGTTPVTSTTDLMRLMKALKSESCVGNVAVYPDVAAVHSGTAQSGGANVIELAAGASGTDNAYQFMVVIITSGTGAGQIRQALASEGTSKNLYVRTWDTNPDATSVYDIRKGMVFEGSGNGPNAGEINEVRRVAYDAAANPGGGATKVYHDKGFRYNDHATLALTNATLKEIAVGASAKCAFAMETTLDGTGTNGSGNNRLVAPSSGVGAFDSAEKDMANSGALLPGSGQGYWTELTLDGGDLPDDNYYQTQVGGQTI